jgi:alkanesulfonate monooxygenase SsuD/methylene tetrahydromethanopterin reductase-like flavin-dependent oxidoreductase (luciferase family)
VSAVLDTARAADAGGLDFFGLSDHPYAPDFLDTLALAGWVLQSTTRLHVYPGVTSLPLRPPAVLAKTAATLDRLSGGRFELGLGAGGSWDGIAGLGGPRRSPGEAVDALDDAITVIRALWHDSAPVTAGGAAYAVRGAVAGPAPAHDLAIWLGALGPRMLALTGRAADGWLVSVPFTPPGKLAEGHARIDEAAAAAGRDPRMIRRAYNVPDAVDDVRGLVGRLVEYAAEHRMDTLVLGPEGDPLRATEVFAAEVVPAVREAVAA